MFDLEGLDEDSFSDTKDDLGGPLTFRQAEIYAKILSVYDSDKKIMGIHNQLTASGFLLPSGKVISGRFLDFAVTKYSKIRNVTYYVVTSGTPHLNLSSEDVYEHMSASERTPYIHFNMWNSYSIRLKTYSKQYFDCFARGPTVVYWTHSGQCIHLSICQLNFLLWMRQFRVLEFVERHIEDIRAVRAHAMKKLKRSVK